MGDGEGGEEERVRVMKNKERSRCKGDIWLSNLREDQERNGDKVPGIRI